METGTFVFLAYVLMLSILLGFELISKVPSILHTPLMSGANAISGITLVGSIVSAGSTQGDSLSVMLGTFSVFFATVNVVGGYAVTNRMLGMFRKKDNQQK